MLLSWFGFSVISFSLWIWPMNELAGECHVTYKHVIIYLFVSSRSWKKHTKKQVSVHQSQPRNLRRILDGLSFITAFIIHVNCLIYCFYWLICWLEMQNKQKRRVRKPKGQRSVISTIAAVTVSGRHQNQTLSFLQLFKPPDCKSKCSSI